MVSLIFGIPGSPGDVGGIVVWVHPLASPYGPSICIYALHALYHFYGRQGTL